MKKLASLLKSDPSPAEPLRSLADELRATLGAAKPSSLLAAERRLALARQDRAAISDQLRGAIHAAQRGDGAPTSKNPFADLQNELAAADETVDRRRSELRHERDAFAPRTAALSAVYRTRIADDIADAAAKLTAAREALRVLDQFAASLGDATYIADRLPHTADLVNLAAELRQ